LNGKAGVEIAFVEVQDEGELRGRARLHKGWLDLFHPEDVTFKGDGDWSDLG
jgi:hypothetical protein